MSIAGCQSLHRKRPRAVWKNTDPSPYAEPQAPAYMYHGPIQAPSLMRSVSPPRYHSPIQESADAGRGEHGRSEEDEEETRAFESVTGGPKLRLLQALEERGIKKHSCSLRPKSARRSKSPGRSGTPPSRRDQPLRYDGHCGCPCSSGSLPDLWCAPLCSARARSGDVPFKFGISG